MLPGADMAPQFQFYTSVTRGRAEREFELEVTYTVGADNEVELLSVTHNDHLFETTADEDDRLHTLACNRADEDMAAWADDQDFDDDFTPLAWAAETYVPGSIAA